MQTRIVFTRVTTPQIPLTYHTIQNSQTKHPTDMHHVEKSQGIHSRWQYPDI